MRSHTANPNLFGIETVVVVNQRKQELFCYSNCFFSGRSMKTHGFRAHTHIPQGYGTLWLKKNSMKWNINRKQRRPYLKGGTSQLWLGVGDSWENYRSPLNMEDEETEISRTSRVGQLVLRSSETDFLFFIFGNTDFNL